MLCANVCAATFLEKSRLPGLYRVHEPPPDTKLASLREVAGIHITEDVGRDFFGDIVERWDAEWGAKTPYVARLRALVASF